MTDPFGRPEEVSPEPPSETTPSEDGGPASTPNPFAAVSDEPGGPAEPAATSEPGGGTVLTDPVPSDIAALAAERDEYLADLQRMKAEFDNYRKRVLRQQEEQTARAAGALVTKLLPVLDNLDLAYTHLARVEGPGEGAAVSEEARALVQAREQLLDALAKEGLERVDEVGVDFDPVVHDAVAHAPADEGEAGAGGDGGVTVDGVLRSGYRWRGQVLRPAMVRVRG